MRRFVAPVLLVALGVFAWRYWGASEPGDSAAAPELSPESDRIYRVGRGDFEILVLVDGTVDAIKRHNLIMQSRRHFPLTLSYVVDDNATVQADDIIMECQSEKIIEKIEDLDKDIEDNLKDLDLQRDNLEIRRSSNLSNLKAAVDKLHNAEDALEKYRDLDSRKTRRDQQEAIEKAEATLASAESELAEAEEERRNLQAEDDAAIAKAEEKVAAKQKARDTATAAVESAYHSQRVWRQYDHPQKMRTLQQSVTQTSIDLKRQTMEANSNIYQIQRQITRLRLRRRQLREELKNYKKDLEGLVIRAPIDGIVSLGNVNRPHWQQPKEWKVGTEVNTGEIVASIPDLSKFLVKCQIPEEHRSRIRLDLPARCRSSAVPDLLMVGRLGEISPVAVNIVRWDQNSPKVYNSQIFTDTTDPRLMPGMSVKVEIVVQTVKDVLFVPVEAVYNRGGQTFVKVRAGASSSLEREVHAGRSSLSHVEITDGLAEGEEVLLVNTAFDAS